jgi:hypothetical protein
VGDGWWQTRVEVSAAGVRISSRPDGAAGDSQAWYQASLPDLHVVSAIGLKLGGAGNFALRGITVTGAPAGRAA